MICCRGNRTGSGQAGRLRDRRADSILTVHKQSRRSPNRPFDYGIVFDEALSHGLPMVSCATGAVPETVPAEARLLVPPDDTTSFAAALRDLLEHPEKRARLASASAALATALPGWANTAQAAGTVLDGPCFD